MARFCEVLAETGRVTAACRAVGKHRDTIYAHRQTNPLFAIALESARADARHRLADGLLEDWLEGSTEYFYRNGELVGERRYRDNRLALAVLRRLDKLAEKPRGPARAPGRKFDAKLALKALRTGAEEDLRAALATLDSDTSDNPPFEDDAIDDVSDSDLGTDRVWQEDDRVWWTNFPPPQGFTGEERGHWSDEDYERECSEDECDLLDAARDVQLANQRAEEAERNTFFAELRRDLDELQDADDTDLQADPLRGREAIDPNRHSGLDPRPAFPLLQQEGGQTPAQGPG